MRRMIGAACLLAVFSLGLGLQQRDAFSAPLCGEPPSELVSRLSLNDIGLCFFLPRDWRFDLLLGSTPSEPRYTSEDERQHVNIGMNLATRDLDADEADRQAFGFVRREYGNFALAYPMEQTYGTGTDIAFVGVASFQVRGVDRILYSTVGTHGHVRYVFNVDLTADYLAAHPEVGAEMSGSLHTLQPYSPPIYWTQLRGSRDGTFIWSLPNNWTLHWWFDCYDDGTRGDTGLFIIELYGADGRLLRENPIPVNVIGRGRIGSAQYHVAGQVSYQVLSDCQWGIAVN